MRRAMLPAVLAVTPIAGAVAAVVAVAETCLGA
jgi:hypothetical protein